MNFEWDESKNKTNIDKHDLDFADARQIFDAPMLVRIDNRKNYGEERSVGILKNLIVVIVFTEPNEPTIRVVSLRKALKYEREQFEKYIEDELGALESKNIPFVRMKDVIRVYGSTKIRS